MRTLVRDGTHPAFATHDPPMVDACRAYADERGLTAEAFGREWFPYLMRRLGERPANVLFIVKSLGHEQADGSRRLARR